PASVAPAASDGAAAFAAFAALGQPDEPDPSFVLVLEGVWPDRAEVAPEEVSRRAAEYWAWTSELAARGVLLAAGDLQWDPGRRVEAGGGVAPTSAGAAAEGSLVVGLFALRVGSYEEALALARECPHLRYGGSVSVRRVGGGFVTTGGFGDWGG
ncbi:MAG: YciI family protein, partial [Longimicrobiales bacterium]